MRRCVHAAVLLLAVTVGVAACGGSDGANSEAGAPEEIAAAKPVTSAEAALPEVVDPEPAEAEPAEPAKKKKKKKEQRRVKVALGDPAEFDLVPTKRKVKKGKVTFKLENSGSIEHELVVIRTDLDSAALPTDADGAAMEHGALAPHGAGDDAGAQHEGGHVGTHVPAGETGSLTLKLKPGRYALVCNLPGHYASGMHANFTVVA